MSVKIIIEFFGRGSCTESNAYDKQLLNKDENLDNCRVVYALDTQTKHGSRRSGEGWYGQDINRCIINMQIGMRSEIE